jgi:hypothetical protein
MNNQSQRFAIAGSLREIISKCSHSKLVQLLRPSPMKKLIRAIVRARFVERWEAVELFARAGNWHTTDYKDYVSQLDAWEIDAVWEKDLRKNLPGAEIKITDTFSEMNLTGKQYNLVVSDNSMSVFADGRFCEHFELFPGVFRILQDKSVLVLNIIPSVTPKWKLKFPYLLDDEHCARRATFYQTNHPKTISVNEMLIVYSKWANTSGFKLEKHVIVKRHIIYYLALFLVRDNAARAIN